MSKRIHKNNEKVVRGKKLLRAFFLFFYGGCDRLNKIEKWDNLHKIEMIEVRFG